MKRVIEGRPKGERIFPKVWPAMDTVQKAPRVRSIMRAHTPMHPEVQHS